MKNKTLFVIVAMSLLLAGCVRATEAEPTSTVQMQISASPFPTGTPTSGPGIVLLVGPQQGKTAEALLEVGSLDDLAASKGLILREIDFDELGAEIGAQTRLVISLGDDERIVDLVEANPNIGFITNTIVEDSPENLYQIHSRQDRYNQTGFFAGYIAALVTPDYRVGGIALAGDGRENAALQGFMNGAVFFCGLCRSTYPPFNEYPQSLFISDPNPAEVSTAAQSLIDLGVTTIYLSPGLSDDEVFNALRNTDVRFIGDQSPLDFAGITWIASIAPDSTVAVEEAWQNWSNDEPGRIFQAPLVVFDVNNEILSPGKQEHLEKVSADLASGRIDPGIDPITGDPR